MPPETRSATEAFDALRAEVSKTHVELRQLTTMIKSRPAPNYDLTLSETAKRLSAMEAQLAHLTLQMPPARLPGEAALPHELEALTEQAKAAAQELREATGAALSAQAHRRRQAACTTAGLVAGVLIVVGAGSLLARQTGGWIAASILGEQDPWYAGQAIMRRSDPESLKRLVRLDKACGDQPTELCEAEIAVRRLLPEAQR